MLSYNLIECCRMNFGLREVKLQLEKVFCFKTNIKICYKIVHTKDLLYLCLLNNLRVLENNSILRQVH